MAACPCAGTHSVAEYAEIVGLVIRGLGADPELILGPLRARIDFLAAAERFEEAADVRDRADALVGALRRQRRIDGLRQAGRLVLELDDGAGAEFDGGRLLAAWGRDGHRGESALPFPGSTAAGSVPPPPPPPVSPSAPAPRELVDELACVAGWLERYAGRIRVVHCDGGLASPLPQLPSFTPKEPRHAR